MTAFHVRLYDKPGCVLCAEAATLIESLRSDFDIDLETVNIEEDPALKEKLAHQIPIVTINGGNRVAREVTEERLRRAFKRALQPHEPKDPLHQTHE